MRWDSGSEFREGKELGKVAKTTTIIEQNQRRPTPANAPL